MSHFTSPNLSLLISKMGMVKVPTSQDDDETQSCMQRAWHTMLRTCESPFQEAGKRAVFTFEGLSSSGQDYSAAGLEQWGRGKSCVSHGWVALEFLNLVWDHLYSQWPQKHRERARFTVCFLTEQAEALSPGCMGCPCLLQAWFKSALLTSHPLLPSPPSSLTPIPPLEFSPVRISLVTPPIPPTSSAV